MKDNCDTLECELALQTSNYMVILELNPQGEEYVASVTITSGTNTVKDIDVKETQQFSVELQSGELLFNFQSQEKALGIQVLHSASANKDPFWKHTGKQIMSIWWTPLRMLQPIHLMYIETRAYPCSSCGMDNMNF